MFTETSMIGLVLESMFSGPMMIIQCIAGVALVFGCISCMRCRMRDCTCIRRCFRCLGIDQFDDFEMMVLVHEAMYTASASKQTTMVRVTAGQQTVETDTSSKGNFQQPLTIFVEQGAATIVIDLCDDSKRVMAKLTLDTMKDILKAEHQTISEKVFTMKQSSKGVMNPRVKLTMAVSSGDDLEAPLLSGCSQEVDWLMRQEMRKTAHPVGKQATELEMITHGCHGPLDLFSGLGKTDTVHVAVHGPPQSKHWSFCVYQDEHDAGQKAHALYEVDLLKVQSVQPDPGRTNVFVVTYYSKDSGARSSQKLVFRRIDRARDVWVEMLQLLVTKVHEERAAKKDKKNNNKR